MSQIRDQIPGEHNLATHNNQVPEKHVDEKDDETDDLRPLSQVANKYFRLVTSGVVDDTTDEAMNRDCAVLGPRGKGVSVNVRELGKRCLTALTVTMKITVANMNGERRRLHHAAAHSFQRKTTVDVVTVSGTM